MRVNATHAPPFASNCGCQKRVWFGSLPTMNSLTVGNVRASCAVKAANWAAPAASSGACRGFAGYTANTTFTPWDSANGSICSISACSGMVVGAAGSHRTVTRTWVRPTSFISEKKVVPSPPLARSSTTPIWSSADAAPASASAAQAEARRVEIIFMARSIGGQRPALLPQRSQYDF